MKTTIKSVIKEIARLNFESSDYTNLMVLEGILLDEYDTDQEFRSRVDKLKQGFNSSSRTIRAIIKI